MIRDHRARLLSITSGVPLDTRQGSGEPEMADEPELRRKGSVVEMQERLQKLNRFRVPAPRELDIAFR
jgi:hypothetical protein